MPVRLPLLLLLLLLLLLPLLALALLPAPPALAETAEPPPEPHLLRNVNDRLEADPGSRILPMGSLPDGRLVFGAGDAGTGREPWVTDGTPEGTFQLADLCPGRCDGVGGRGILVNGKLLFLAIVSPDRDFYHEVQYVLTDGTRDGTRPVFTKWSTSTQPGATNEISLQSDGGSRLFVRVLQEDQRSYRLWVTDGTRDGTRTVPTDGRRVGSLVGVVGGRLLFRVGRETWATDGTAEGTIPLSDFPAEYYEVVSLGPDFAVLVTYLGSRSGLWRTDGTTSGTVFLTELEGSANTYSSLVSEGRLVLTTYLRTEGLPNWLWTTDGTLEGTHRLLEGRPVGILDEILFRDGKLLHGSNETEPRLVMVDLEAPSEIVPVEGLPGLEAGELVDLSFLGDEVAYEVRSENEHALWSTDLTPEGTRSIFRVEGDEKLYWRRIGPEGGESLLVVAGRDHTLAPLYVGDGDGRSLVEVGRFLLGRFAAWPLITATALDDGVVLFAGERDGYGEELWRTDGTPGGTRLVENLALPHDDGDSDPTDWIRVGDRLLFFANDGDGTSLWETDGTEAGTRRLHDVPGTGPDRRSDLGFVLAMEGLVYVVPDEGDYRDELMVADLARGELRLLLQGGQGEGGMVGVPLGGKLLFAARSQLVMTDGTPSGTLSLGNFQLSRLAALDDGTALGLGWGRAGNGGELRRGLWRTDGTPSGTRLVLEMEEVAVRNPRVLTAVGNIAWFVLPAPGGGFRDETLWFTDGTALGTRRVADLPAPERSWLPGRGPVAVEGRVFFVIGDKELWVGEGQGAVRRVSTIESDFEPDLLTPGSEGLGIRFLTPFRGGVLFAATHSWYGDELMWSDGTAEGTTLVADLDAGSGNSRSDRITVAGDRAYFRADRNYETWIWTTDGTFGGTAPLVRESPDLVFPPDLEMAVLGDRLFFTAEEPRSGLEPWVLDLTRDFPPLAPPPVPAPPHNLRVSTRPLDRGPSLSWSAARTGELFFAIEARRFDESGFRVLRRVPGDHRWVSLLGELELGVPYLVRLRAINGTGTSDSSEPVALYWPEDFRGSFTQPHADPCRPEDPETLCLLDEEFRVRVAWRDPRTGRTGQGVALPLPENDRTGTFWFFDPDNVELAVKVLDGTAINDHYWVLAGGLTDLEYWLTVADTVAVTTRTYHSPPGDRCGIVDDRALERIRPGGWVPVPAASIPASGTGGTATPAPLSLLDGRFRVEVEWRDPRTGNTGTGTAIPGTGRSGYFWFFRDDNVELVVKVLDGTPVNGHHWVFWGALTDVEYDLRVIDVEAGEERTYHNPPGNVCGGADTAAFGG